MVDRGKFQVMSEPCESCIYKGGLGWNLTKLENDVRDKHIGFRGHRICHHHPADAPHACCRGFWNAHKDEFAAGQVAQRLDLVEYVDVD